MSRDDDFDDIMDSPDEMDAAPDDASEPLLDDSLDVSPADEVDVVVTGILLEETEEDELAAPPEPPRPATKPKPAKKVAKKVVKKVVKPGHSPTGPTCRRAR